jgi:predicted 2-oxoglutarate/Fe(II)-dependent dioxygenase YbiX
MFEHSDIYSYVKKNGEHVTPSLTAILYLNDDYVGGEINFVHDDFCAKPQAGSMFVFPSNKQHEVLEITSGDRYMVQTYVYPNPVDFYDKP